jgi:hypothetical protein
MASESSVEEPANDSFEVASLGGIDSTRVVVDSRGSSPSRKSKEFHNCGLETWLRAREVWKQRTVDTLPEKPTPAEHSQLVKGLTRSSSLRTYELPRRMALSDLINVYNDIWEGDV